jgi:hypothetical protein
MAPTSRSKFFSWGSKSGRQQFPEETYYRTGGLLQIDTHIEHENQFVQCVDLGDAKVGATIIGDALSMSLVASSRWCITNDVSPYRGQTCILHSRVDVFHWLASQLTSAQDTTWRRNLKNLSIVPPNYITGQSPDSALQNDALVKSAPNLLAVFSDTTFPITSGLSPKVCINSKYSLPPSPALPAELPGSILLDNQGYSAPATPPPEPDAESVHSSAVTSVRSMFSLSSGNAKTGPSKVPQHRKSANDLQNRAKARPSLIASPSSTDSRITTLSTLSIDNASSANSTKTRTGPGTIVEGKQWHTVEEVTIKVSLLFPFIRRYTRGDGCIDRIMMISVHLAWLPERLTALDASANVTS